MATWDVFHADRLEVERSLTIETVRQALARGDLRDDDLIRPAGTTSTWVRLADFPNLLAPETTPEPEPITLDPSVPPSSLGNAQENRWSSQLIPPTISPPDNDEEPPEFADFEDEDEGEREFAPIDQGSQLALPVSEPQPFADDDLEFPPEEDEDDDSLVALPVGETDTGWSEELEEDLGNGDQDDEEDEDEAIAEFTLSRGDSERVEELDLAAMVDVAFQLVLFFLVTATTVLYKSLEVPKPNPDSPAAAAAQGRSQSLDELKDNYILVEIDQAGAMKIDREPVAADMAGLIERLRVARETTGRKAMLLSADFATPHRNAVLAYDAANEIGLGIAIARPTGADSGAGPAANPPPAAKPPAQS